MTIIFCVDDWLYIFLDYINTNVNVSSFFYDFLPKAHSVHSPDLKMKMKCSE